MATPSIGDVMMVPSDPTATSKVPVHATENRGSPRLCKVQFVCAETLRDAAMDKRPNAIVDLKKVFFIQSHSAKSCQKLTFLNLPLEKTPPETGHFDSGR